MTIPLTESPRFEPPRFEPKDPDWRRKVHDDFVTQGFMRHIGAELAASAPGHCVIRLPWRDEVGQHHGFFHGGVIGTIADNAGGFAGGSLLPPGMEVLTVEYKLNIVAPGQGEALVAEGHVVKPGRTLIITRVDVFSEKAGQRTLCAVAQQTLMAIDASRLG